MTCEDLDSDLNVDYVLSDIDSLKKQISELQVTIEEKDKEIAILSNDVNMLDRGLHEHKSRHEQNWTNVFNQLSKEKEELKKEISLVRADREHWISRTDKAEQELKNQPTLNRQEVEKIFYSMTWEFSNKHGTLVITTEESEAIITAICNLALPDRDKIIKVLSKYVHYYTFGMGSTELIDVSDLADEIIAIGGK